MYSAPYATWWGIRGSYMRSNPSWYMRFSLLKTQPPTIIITDFYLCYSYTDHYQWSSRMHNEVKNGVEIQLYVHNLMSMVIYILHTIDTLNGSWVVELEWTSLGHVWLDSWKKDKECVDVCVRVCVRIPATRTWCWFWSHGLSTVWSWSLIINHNYLFIAIVICVVEHGNWWLHTILCY